MKLPVFLEQYFWDVDTGSLDDKRDKRFIIERILEKGDEQAVSWLRRTYHDSEIIFMIRKSRQLSPKSRAYWELIYHVWFTKHPSAPKRAGIWQR